MASNTVKARIQLKSDTEENWNKAGPKANSPGFIPLRGEVIIYLTDDAHPFSRLKVGDGITPITTLPFVANDSSDKSIQYNTTEYWSTKQTYIPQAGQIIIYSDKYTIEKDGQFYNQPALKIGDGKAYLIDLPFLDDSFMNHINNTAIHISTAERAFWNNKINCEDTIDGETLVLNRR